MLPSDGFAPSTATYTGLYTGQPNWQGKRRGAAPNQIIRHLLAAVK